MPVGLQAGPEPSVDRGRYLAENLALCIGCHTAYDPKTFTPTGPKAAGGVTEASHGKDSDMEFTPRRGARTGRESGICR